MKNRLDEVLTYLLMVLILLASAIIAYGGLQFIVEHGVAVPDYAIFSGEPKALKGISGVYQLLMKGSSLGIIQAGLLLLMVIPVVRLALITFYFIVERDRLYSWVSAFALLVLLGSIFLEVW